MKKQSLKVLAIICICGLVYSIYQLILWRFDSSTLDKQITLSQEIANVTEVKSSDDTDNFNSPEDKADPYWDYIKTSLIDVNFADLKKINSDTKGWIQVPSTNINYPFVQTNNNDFYLNHAFDKSRNYAGWVFLDYRNNPDGLGENTIIYAHSRVGGKMFGTLNKVTSNDWYLDKSNHTIKLSAENANTLWQVFSVYQIKTTNDYLQTSFSAKADHLNYIDMIKSRSLFDFHTTLNTDDKILTLSTCYGETKKTVIHAKLIKISPK